jgi:hypothetical protein
VNALLLTEFSTGTVIARSESDHVIHTIDGRGGDGGVDSRLDSMSGDLLAIFQLKFFPGGFPKESRTQRRQIEKSFKTAWKNHSMKKWILVIATNPTVGESEFVHGLTSNVPDGFQCEIEILGEAELDVLLAKHQDIHAWATRNAAIAELSASRLENMTVTTAEQVAGQHQRLAAHADTLSPYWGIETVVSSAGTVQKFYAKHPDAAKLEPLTLSVEAQFGSRDALLKKSFESMTI